MYKICFLSILLLIGFSSSSLAQRSDWALGFRLGNPSGLTVKKYTAGSGAWEFNVGRSYLIRDRACHRGFYCDNWNGYQQGDRFRGPFTLQLHYLAHFPVGRQKPVEGLQWYIGTGGQFRFQRIPDGYDDWNDDDRHAERGDRRLLYDFGIDGVVGLEYTIQRAPVSFFADAILFMELVDDPFLFDFGGGLGARYRF